MNILTKQYLSNEVAVAAGIDHKAVQNWTTRGLITGHSGGGGRGRTRYFSWSNVMEVAVAAEFMRLGITAPQDAFAAAMPFSHTGDERSLGLPHHYRDGETYLFAAGGKSVVELVSGESPNLSHISLRLDGAASFIVLNLKTLFFDVARRMGIDPVKALDTAYSESAE